MLGKIISTNEETVDIRLGTDLSNLGDLINCHVIFEEGDFKIVGEIKDINVERAHIVLIGEIRNNNFFSGVTKRPSFNSNCRIINKEELDLLIGNDTLSDRRKVYFGQSPLYRNYPINVNVNNFFSNHFAIFGSTGSGKSYTITRLLQNIFYNPNDVPVNANIFLFDVYGEYHYAFRKISEYSNLLNYKTYTTNLKFPDTEVLKIPVWLLGVDDIALLLEADNHIQLPIIEKALRLVSVFAKEEASVITYKNDIIARALLEILYSGNTPSQIRDQIFAVLTAFNTKDLNLESKLVQPGYVRTLRQCLNYR